MYASGVKYVLYDMKFMPQTLKCSVRDYLGTDESTFMHLDRKSRRNFLLMVNINRVPVADSFVSRRVELSITPGTAITTKNGKT